MAKLSKSRESERANLVVTLAPAFQGVDGDDSDELAIAVVDSDWLAEVRSSSFWAGIKALADLTGVELDDYTRASIVDPYGE